MSCLPRRRVVALAVAAWGVFGSYGCERVQRLVARTSATVAVSPVTWKGVLMTGDDGIDAFDNARTALKDVWVARGLRAANIRELSMNPLRQRDGVKASSLKNLDLALKSLQIRDGDGCVLHLTSHGAPWGFHMRDQPPLSPAQLDRLLDKHCGVRPTVVFVSACYSGVFAGNVMRGPSRILFTAARDDRNSFGCGVEDVYTFWDDCAIRLLPATKNWRDFKRGMETCIRAKEGATQLRFSYPQAFIGDKMLKLPVLGARRVP